MEKSRLLYVSFLGGLNSTAVERGLVSSQKQLSKLSILRVKEKKQMTDELIKHSKLWENSLTVLPKSM